MSLQQTSIAFSKSASMDGALSKMLIRACRYIDCPPDTFSMLFGASYEQAQAGEITLSSEKIDCAIALVRSYEHLSEITDNLLEQTQLMNNFDEKLGCKPAELFASEAGLKQLSMMLCAKAHQKRTSANKRYGAY